ncbi:MAG: hypothetical protein RL272_842 [Candidatus Parcubacteria bacterium]
MEVDGGSVRFAYGDDGGVTGTFEDVAYRGSGFEALLHDDWREAVARATGGANGDTQARQVALDDIAATARIAEVHRQAYEALASAGKRSSPEAAFLARSVVEKLDGIRSRYGDIVRMPGEEAPATAASAPAGKAPAGFEDTPRKYGPDGAFAGYDLSKGFVAPAGFRARFEYGPDGTVAGFDADAKVGMDTLARVLLKPDWNLTFEAQVAASTRRSWLEKIADAFTRRKPKEPQAVRAEMADRFASLLFSVFVYGQALLGLERAGMGKLYEAGFLRRAIEDAKKEAVAVVGGKDVFQ